jgi:hypothetical protein
MSDDLRTFVCRDCGLRVYAYPHDPERERCGACEWIKRLPEKVDRDEVRAYLVDIGVIGDKDPEK